MESEELFYPEISVAIGSYALQKGVEVEVYCEDTLYTTISGEHQRQKKGAGDGHARI